MSTQVVRWRDALHADGSVFSILPMASSVLLLFLCRLWLTANYPTIESTMKAIKSVHREHALPDPFGGPMEWVIKRLIRAFKKMSPKPGKQRRRPITTVILMMVADSNTLDFTLHDTRCLWAALVVAVFALLRASEFLDKDDGKLLTHGDLAWANEGRTARLTLHNTKTMVWDDDLFAYVFQNDSGACPTTALHQYLNHMPAHLPRGASDPLLTLSSGKRLTRSTFIPWVQGRMGDVGLEEKDYDGISARKGGAASLRLADAPNDIIRKMGRWADSSFVFERYQALSARDLSAFASRISKLSADELTAQGKGPLLWGEFDTNGIFIDEEISDFVQQTNGQSLS